jgi:1-acyl-sn-glycerol-3-phosphate acyltransferase
MPIYLFWVRFWQKALLVFSYILAFIVGVKIYGRENISRFKKGPLIILSNHKSFIDSPLLGLCFPFFSSLYPLRFMTYDGFFKDPFRRILFLSFGAFPAMRGEGLEKSLQMPARLLNSGQVILIFPEGTRYFGKGISSGKPGAAILAWRFGSVPIIPVAIYGSHDVSIRSIMRRKSVSVLIGKPFLPAEKNFTGKPKEDILIIMNEISALYKLLDEGF